MNFQLPNHIVEYVQSMGNMAMLEASPNVKVNVFTKLSYRSTSKRIATSMDEAVTNMVPTLSKRRHNFEPQQRIQY